MRTTGLMIAVAATSILFATVANAALVISKAATQNVNCAAGVCTATAADAVLNAKDLANMLAASDMKVFAEGPATDITVAAPFSWTSANRLTLGAYGSINVKDVVTVAGTGGLTIAANVAQTDGLFRLVGAGKISFWDTSSSLIINNVTYALINNLPALINAVATNASGAYAFAKDYDAAQDGSYPHSPIPTTFNGIFEGLGNAIGNLSIYNSNANSEKISLFAQVGNSGQLSDVVLTNISMQAATAYLAPLAAVNNGTITHSSATGALSGLGLNTWSMAGLVTDNEGIITRSHAAVTMDGLTENAGGIAASNSGTISLSDASGAVNAVALAGGLVGYSTGTITQSLALGDVDVSLDYDADAGGLVGQLGSGTIDQSFATGDVRGGDAGAKKSRLGARFAPPKMRGINLGGLAGFSAGFIGNSYATGSVTGIGARQAKHPSVGGLVGQTSPNVNASHIVQSYALGALSLYDTKYLGGVIGSDFSAQGSNSNALWDLDTTGVTNTNQGAGNLFDDRGLKGVPESKFRKATIRKFSLSIWAENANINNGYPYLIANPPPK